jgi:uncharacterized protein (DUF2235 family)
MPKTIIFCADGTWNGPGDVDENGQQVESADSKVTNVVKLFCNLAGDITPETRALKNEKEKVLLNPDGAVAQIAKYLHGVGDSSNVLIRTLGGVFGAGIIDRIVRGYTFISRNYAPGDAIHIVGFSRGAYTARALGGMIAKVGLLDPKTYDASNKTRAYGLGIAAWARSKGIALTGTDGISGLANRLLGDAQSLLGMQLKDNMLIPGVTIKSVAVWDTVGSLGIPNYASGARMDLFRFTDTALSDRIENGLHAMAIDELRVDFPVTRWDERKGVRQVWFAGAHSDVGGGYPPAECGLSDLGLGWMMKRLEELGAKFDSKLEFDPQTAGLQMNVHTPWKNPPFNLTKQVPRQVLPSDEVDESVIRRWDSIASYRPDALAAWAKARKPA